ncbi:uncharacterized protein LOC127849002 [Dreissena polymorpha]|uniref:uncharacterized protein LOC127849002 n=1 Tax=Dreissena polymorpha TaxID=45954 RepID=UPI002264AEDA|nr:uncharacterized protein LOC127849002 [Dreissena polymorpha]
MCQITPSEVAVTVDSRDKHKVQFITVKNRQHLTGRKLRLEHRCIGIAFHQDEMYITAGTALYKYTLKGKLVSKVYEDKSESFKVNRCVVSHRGDTLYITHSSQNQLLTLVKDGSALTFFTDPALQWPQCVHVTPGDQVLVCGYNFHTILQVDCEGRRKLATIASKEDGVVSPRSVCYNRNTDSILLGLGGNSSILEFKVQ